MVHLSNPARPSLSNVLDWTSLTQGYDLPPPATLIIVLSYVVAMACTVARLFYRWYTRRFWWEDVWATVAVVFGALSLAGLELYNDDFGPAHTRVPEWLQSISFTLVLWATRISIFLSLIRVSNPTGGSRRIALACLSLFIVMCLALTGQKIYYCAVYQCYMYLPVAVAQLVTDIISDTILVLGPIFFLWDLRLSKNRRILILSAFSSSILISAVSIAHSILMLIYNTNGATLIFGQLKASLSLFICNILVIITFAYRVLRRRGERSGIDLDESFGKTPMHFTTIDLNQLTAGTLSGGDPTIASRNFGNSGVEAGMSVGTQECDLASRTSHQGEGGEPSTTDENLETTKRIGGRDGVGDGDSDLDSKSDVDKDGEFMGAGVGHDVC